MSKVIKKDRKPLPEIKILEKFSPDVIEFQTKDEFRAYLAEHVDEMNALTTQRLNKMYKITDYHITKLDGEISLKRLKKIEKNNDESESEQTTIRDEITALQSQIDAIVTILKSAKIIPE